MRKPNAIQRMIHRFFMLCSVTVFFAPRTPPLIAMFDEKQIGLVASSFGRQQNPGWYYNLKAHPACEVQFNGRATKYIAHEATGEEYSRFWQLAVSVYEGYDKYKQRAAHRHLPVMVLEPKK